MDKQVPIFFDIDAGSAYSKAWYFLKSRFLELLMVVVLYFVIQLPVVGFVDDYVGIRTMGWVYIVFFLQPVRFSLVYAYVMIVRNEKFNYEKLFNAIKNNFINIFLASIMTAFIIGIGFVFLIIPGIIFAVRLAFVPYLVTDKQMDAITAINTSWRMTGKYSWTIFFMALMCVPIAIGGLVLFGIGIIIATMWIGAAFAVLYDEVDKRLIEGVR